jgi:hypothetical protein
MRTSGTTAAAGASHSSLPSCSSPPWSVTRSHPEYTTVPQTAGQPGGAFLRVLNDSTSLPASGVSVTAVEHGYSSNCDVATASAFDWQTTYAFVTNNTKWYPLNTLDAEGYLFTVVYSSHAYLFVAQLGPVINTCATLYLPSGKTNITSSGLNSCASAGP